MRGKRYSYVGTFLGHINSHDVTGKRLGYNWFVIDRTQKVEENDWLPWKIVRRCYTRAEAREVAKHLNENGYVHVVGKTKTGIMVEIGGKDDKRVIS